MGVPEWLSGMTRNHVGFARAGSNPAAHVLSSSDHIPPKASRSHHANDYSFFLL